MRFKRGHPKALKDGLSFVATIVDIGDAVEMDEANSMGELRMDNMLGKLKIGSAPMMTAVEALQQRSPALTSGLSAPVTCACTLGRSAAKKRNTFVPAVSRGRDDLATKLEIGARDHIAI